MSVIVRTAGLSDTAALAGLAVQARVFHNRLSDNYFADPDPRAESLFFKQAVTDENKIILAAEKNGAVAGFFTGLSEKAALSAQTVRLSG